MKKVFSAVAILSCLLLSSGMAVACGDQPTVVSGGTDSRLEISGPGNVSRYTNVQTYGQLPGATFDVGEFISQSAEVDYPRHATGVVNTQAGNMFAVTRTAVVTGAYAGVLATQGATGTVVSNTWANLNLSSSSRR
jgi:hypothetical protein